MARTKKFIENGIDISHWQGNIDFQKVKNSGIDFVIIKAGGSDKGFYTDRKFYDNVRLAQLSGLKVGAYYFVGKNFVSFEDGVEDAKRFTKIIHGIALDYPVCLDIESTNVIDKIGATEACVGFCKYLEKKGYYVVIYASDISGFKERLDIDKLKDFDKWVARYGSKPEYVKKYGMWQKSSTGIIDGIDSYVDLDESYIDYSSIIHLQKLNRG